MGISAHMTDARVSIGSSKLDVAYQAVKAAYGSKKIEYRGDPAYLNELLSQADLAAFFKKQFYEVKKTQAGIVIGKGDLDKITDEFCKLFETLAPFVEPGGYIYIEDEEEQYLNLTFDGEKVEFDGDAF